MKHLLITIAAVVLVGCGESQQSTPAPETKPVDPVAEVPTKPPSPVGSQTAETVAEAVNLEAPKAKAPDISIHDAAKRGNIEAVKMHLAAGTDVNARDNDSHTPLHAAAGQHEEIVELLIANGADVNAKKKTGETPLHNAAANGHKEVAELLIAEGADVNAVTTSGLIMPLIGTTPLHWSAGGGGRVEVSWRLSDSGVKAKSRPEVAALLIANGADVNAKTQVGMTPLHIAAHEGRMEITELLIAKGADLNAKDNGGETPLDRAILMDYPKIAELLRKHGGKSGAEDSLYIAARTGNIEAVKQHLAAGKDVNALDKHNKTPLDAAKYNLEIADLLRKHGGKTAKWLKAQESIHIAAESGNIEAVKKHLADGTDVNTKDDEGSTPLHYAAFKGYKEIAELLITAGANVNAKDENGGTPLRLAAFGGHKEIAELLITAGANVNAKDGNGETLLYVAASLGQKEIVELLISKRAEVNAKHNGGETTLDRAILMNKPKIADLLRKHGGKTGEELEAEGK